MFVTFTYSDLIIPIPILELEAVGLTLTISTIRYILEYLPIYLTPAPLIVALVLFASKRIEIHIEDRLIDLRLMIKFMPYLKYRIKYDNYKIDDDTIILFSGDKRQIKFDIGLAVEETKISSITIWIGDKFLLVGNEKMPS